MSVSKVLPSALVGDEQCSVHSYEVYHREADISHRVATPVKSFNSFFCFDLIDQLSEDMPVRWLDPIEHKQIIDQLIEVAR